MHIIHNHDNNLSIVVVEVAVSLIFKLSKGKSREMSLHCGHNLIGTASRVIRSINSEQDEYKIIMILDDHLGDNNYFVEDGQYLIYSNPN